MVGRVWLGIFFLLFGLGFLLHQADIINLSQLLSNWWPLLLIMIGGVLLINRKHSSVSSGLLLIFIGLLFLINQWVDVNLAPYIWPLIFIVIGLIIIFTRGKQKNTLHRDADLNTFALFSGAEVNSQSKNFQGGSVTAIFGGAEIDLREAVVAEEASINITTLMGGADITVPENVRVELSGIPILGGWENKTRVREENEGIPTLKINCLTILGGVDIKN